MPPNTSVSNKSDGTQQEPVLSSGFFPVQMRPVPTSFLGTPEQGSMQTADGKIFFRYFLQDGEWTIHDRLLLLEDSSPEVVLHASSDSLLRCEGSIDWVNHVLSNGARGPDGSARSVPDEMTLAGQGLSIDSRVLAMNSALKLAAFYRMRQVHSSETGSLAPSTARGPATRPPTADGWDTIIHNGDGMNHTLLCHRQTPGTAPGSSYDIRCPIDLGVWGKGC
ncbi:hypothetical protein IAT38_008444 [Cryptococcus sp. DSM 104549]